MNPSGALTVPLSLGVHRLVFSVTDTDIKSFKETHTCQGLSLKALKAHT